MSVRWHVSLVIETFATDVATAEKEAWAIIEKANSLDDIKTDCAAYEVSNVGEVEVVEDDTD